MPNTKPESALEIFSAIHPGARRHVRLSVHQDTPSTWLFKSHRRQPNTNRVTKTYTFEISRKRAAMLNPAEENGPWKPHRTIQTVRSLGTCWGCFHNFSRCCLPKSSLVGLQWLMGRLAIPLRYVYWWEIVHFPRPISHNVEGNGTPLQYSCLENPKGGGAW